MTLDELSRRLARTWPGLEQQQLGQWELRAAGGFTGRANSALPLGDPGCGLEPAMQQVIAWYRERGLAPRVQVPSTLDGSGGPADAVAQWCDRAGWSAEPWTLVLVREPRPIGATAGLSLAWSSEPDGQWLDLYQYRGSQLPPAARRVITAAPAGYLTASLDGAVVGIGRAALADEVVVLTAIEVAAAHRRRGFGRVLTEALADWGGRQGATMSALQVFTRNEPAVRLYEQLGYTPHHRYLYRCLAES